MTDSATGIMASMSSMSNPGPGGSPAAEAAPVIVRPSRDEDVNAMLDIYRRHIMRGSSRPLHMIRKPCSPTR